jgi:hypothetical protein
MWVRLSPPLRTMEVLIVGSERHLGSGKVLLDGAVDMHVHYGPEPLTDLATGQHHSVDPLTAVEDAETMGFGAVVLKPHEFPSTVIAAAAERRAKGVRVFGGICCDFPVGGLNPEAVEVALRSGARIVWLPTFSSRTTSYARMMRMWGHNRGISLLTGEGHLTPVVREIMDLVVEYDALLASGHIAHDEQFAVAEAFGRTGRLIVTHAMQSAAGGGAGPGLSPQQCARLVELGATLEFSARMCMGMPEEEDKVASTITAIGADHVVLSSDYGWNQNMPDPGPGLRSYIDRLWELGIAEKLLRTMAVTNPSRLLKIGQD